MLCKRVMRVMREKFVKYNLNYLMKDISAVL